MEWRPLLGVAFVTCTVGYVAFNTDDRLDTGFFGRLIDIDRTVQIAVIGECDRWLI